jgi:MoaA/NifB/PqqE/SkfB family radical SAM enzyme
MRLSSLHILLTYQCTLECDHCFVWGSPWQAGTITLAGIEYLLAEAQGLGSVESVYFEGGEPFLFYPLLLAGTQVATRRNFQVGIVTNGYWATSLRDALKWLEPLAGLVSDLSISSDLYHWSQPLSRQAGTARAAAEQLGIPAGIIYVESPGDGGAQARIGQLPIGESRLMYRGRAAQKLAARAPARPWQDFTSCPHEDLEEPGRVHVDPFGNVHLCQGLIIGNVYKTSLRGMCRDYRPEAHPVASALHEGGPAELYRRFGLTPREGYADACEMCDAGRRCLRSNFPALLGPDQMYGLPHDAGAH